MKRLSLLVLFFVWLSPSLSNSTDWYSCADDLDRLRRAARDAADIANDVKAKADDFENCKRFPDIYDLIQDRCRGKAYDYQSALSNLKSELNTVDRRIRSVSSSCGMVTSLMETHSSAEPGTPSSGNPLCEVYRSYKNRLPMETIMKICSKSMSEAECRSCLSQ